MATGDRVCERCENFHVTAAVTRQAEYKIIGGIFLNLEYLGVAFHGLIRQSAIQTSCRLFGVVLASGPKTKRSLRSFF